MMTTTSPTLSTDRNVAYFSMEIGLENDIATYSGGLGMLAGDTIRSAADQEIPMVAVSLIHRKGYFSQQIDKEGMQQSVEQAWTLDSRLIKLPAKAEITLESRPVALQAWQYTVTGCTGYTVPVLLLDADLPQNNSKDRRLTDNLYGGDESYRLAQECILGIGGVKILRALGYNDLKRFHMNEGHASLLVMELLREQLQIEGTWRESIVDSVRKKCVFTTHTPVPAGHDQFSSSLVDRVLGHNEVLERLQHQIRTNGTLNMTHIGLNFSHYVNGVAKKHGEVSRDMFPNFPIDSITNGIHCETWCSAGFKKLFDRYMPDWRQDNFILRDALKIPLPEIWQAHQESKQALLDYITRETGETMDPELLTVGFARRAAAYKRADLLFEDVDALNALAEKVGGLQLVYAGKAHPKDEPGKALIQRVIQSSVKLSKKIKFVYLPNYDMNLGKLITAGVDVWLNNPKPPLEASGTSGMKAALNGVPSLSVLDGWWLEGHIEGVTGWEIPSKADVKDDAAARIEDAEGLYNQLDKILRMYYQDRNQFVEIMRHSIALNGSFFNTQRMMQQYVVRAYFR